jgi:hypothetical protein
VIRASFLFAAAAFVISGQERLPSSLPAALRVPGDRTFLFQAHGAGVQIYTCKDSWTLKAPDAQLLGIDGTPLGRHFAGPTWESKDGSRVAGKAIANSPSPDPAAVPWLLIDATRHEGTGKMAAVVTIQRLNTKGGKAPADGCDAAHASQEWRVPYEADYYFYGAGK